MLPGPSCKVVNALKEDVGELLKDVSKINNHELQTWMFFFGQRPNGRDIDPTQGDHGCGQMSEATKNLNRMGWFIPLGL